jgi:hypothetical protein
MTNPAKTLQPHPTHAGSPRFRGVWNGRHEFVIPADATGQPSRASTIVATVRRGTAAPVLPGRAAIGVLGAPRRTRRPGAAD